MALPRGGVPVGFEVARALQAPLEVFVVRKLGVPGHEELAMGAIASGGIRVLNPRVIAGERIPPDLVEAVTRQQLEELHLRERAYRDDLPPVDVRGRIVILTDDGVATGSTMRAAIAALRAQDPARIVVAVPVATTQICQELGAEADEVICAHTPEPFYAVGLWYDDFTQTEDAEIRALLRNPAVASRPTHSEQGESPGDVAG
jgi:predicted phosphoribosyltransferase